MYNIPVIQKHLEIVREWLLLYPAIRYKRYTGGFVGFVPLPSIYRTVFLLAKFKKKKPNFVLQEFFIQPELFHVSILAYHRHCHPLGRFVRRQRVCKVLYSLLSMVCSVGWKSVRAMKLHWTRNIFIICKKKGTPLSETQTPCSPFHTGLCELLIKPIPV